MSKRTFSYLALLWGMFFFMQPALFSQNDLSSESALKKEAQKAYDDEDFGAALKFYSRLLSVNLKDPLYNYRYGVCLLEASPDKDEAIKYLEKAVKDPDLEKEVYYFYGKALQLNYRFNDAIAAFTKYKSIVTESKAKKMQVDHLIETCKNGKSLLRKITDLQVVDRKDLEDKDFFLSYDLTDIGGRLLIKPDDFKTSLDKKKKEQSIIFLSQDKSEIYFSSYGNSDENGKDIYVIKLLPNGEYSKPVSLGYPINTEFDEDYPFLHPNGRVLYFASKGHNSMGGYDIFKSERNEETGTWGKPVNLDFAINTPDDDILYVTDKDEKTAFFASRRNSPNGRIDVYKINTERRPVDICIFKGRFIPFKPGQSQAAKITVKNVEANEVESVVKSNEGTGEYTLNLPNGGKFLVTVETIEGDVQSEVLVIPQQFETVPIRQELGYKPEDGKLKITSLFGQGLADDDNYALPIDFIKDRSKLDVNTSRESKETLPVAVEKKDSSAVLAQADTATAGKKKDLTNEDLIHIAEQDAADLEKDALEARAAADKALVIVNEKNQKAVELNKKTDEANASAAAIAEPGQKQIEQSRADALQVQTNAAEAEALAANNFYKGLDADAQKKQKEADLSKQYAKDLQEAIQSKSKDAMARLDAQKEALDKMSEDKSGAPDDLVAAIRREADDKQKEVNKVRDESSKIRDDIRGIETEIANLNRESGQTQNQQLKDGINSQIAQLKEESKTKERDLSENDLKLGKLQKQAENLANEAYLVHQMNEQIKSGQVAGGSETIDKDKLDAQISQYNRKTEETNAAAAVSDTSHTITEINNPRVVPANGAQANPAEKIDAKYSEALMEAGAKGTEQEKEQHQAEVLNKWSEELNATIASKKEKMKTESDKESQQKLLNDITELQKQQEEKARLAAEHMEKAGKQNGASETLAGNNQVNSSGTGAGKSSDLDNNSNELFNKKLQAIDTISNSTARENARAEAEKERSEQIEKEIAGVKQERNAASDPLEKEKLNTRILALQKEAQLHKDRSEASVQKADNLRKGAVVPSGSSDSYSTEFSDRLASSDQLASGTNKDSVKAVVYNEWAQRLRSDIEVKKQAELTESDPTRKKAAAQQIADMETELSGKEAAARRSEELADKRRRQKASAGALADEKSNHPYTSAAARTADQERMNKENESALLKAKADSLKTIAASMQGTEKQTQLAEAARLEQESHDKQVEALAASSRASEDEYIQNEQKLNKLESENELSSKPGLEQAHASVSEAKMYFDKARIARKAALTTSGTEQESNLKEAAEAEQIAFAKQQEAIMAYTRAANEKPSATLARDSSGNTISNTDLSARNQSAKSDSLSGSLVNKAPASSTDSLTRSEANVSGSQAKENSKSSTDGAVLKNGSDAVKENNTLADTNALARSSAVKPAMSAEKIAVIKKTDTYKNYLHLKAQMTIEQEEVAADNAHIQEYQQKAQNYMREGNQIIASAGSISDTSLRADAMKKAKELDDLAALNFSRVDSVRDHARRLSEKANQKQKDAQESLSSSDTLTRQEIVYLASVESPKNIEAAAAEPVKAGSGAKNAGKSKTSAAGAGVAKTTVKTNPKHTTAKPSGQGVGAESTVQKADTKNTQAKTAEQGTVATNNAPKNNPKNTQAKTPGQVTGTANNTAKNNPKNDKSKTTGNGVLASNTSPKAGTNNAQAKTPGNTAGKTDGLTQNKPKEKSVSETKAPPKADGGIASNSPKTGAGINSDKTEQNKSVDKSSEKLTTAPAISSSGQGAFMITSAEAVPKNIPIDTKLPEGLVYKVQVGAFRNPISGDLFKGVSPLMGETTTKGFIRYTAGIFTDQDAAEKAKKEVRALGFNDAFVVAFYNGKRISIDQAAGMSAGRSTGTQPEATGTPQRDSSTGIGVAGMPFRTPKNQASDDKNTNTNSAGNRSIDSVSAIQTVTGSGPAGTSPNTGQSSKPAKVDNAMPVVSKDKLAEIAVTTPVTQVKGLFYTIQVGVYSNPVTNAKLYGIQPLNSEKLANGTIRYTSGQYSDLNNANQAKAKIVQLGIKDAFVVVYDNGKRIPLVNPKSLNNSGLPANISPIPNTAAEKPGAQVTTPERTGAVPATETLVKPAADVSRLEAREIVEAKADTGIIYKVQIGAFKDEVPVEIANKFLLLAKRGVRNFKDENGNTVFTIGRSRKFEDAQFLKEEALAKGIPDAFIIALKDGKKIPLSEARSAQ